jgi:hypothetical protein
MAKLHFDLNEVKESSGFSPLPSGEYTAIVASETMKTTQSGNGEYLALQIQIIEGEYADRKIFENLNIHNANEQAEQIARSNLKALGIACGLPGDFSDTSDLLDRPFIVRLGIDRKDPDRNRVMGYRAIGDAAQPLKPASQPAATPARAWERK